MVVSGIERRRRNRVSIDVDESRRLFGQRRRRFRFQKFPNRHSRLLYCGSLWSENARSDYRLKVGLRCYQVPLSWCSGIRNTLSLSLEGGEVALNEHIVVEELIRKKGDRWDLFKYYARLQNFLKVYHNATKESPRIDNYVQSRLHRVLVPFSGLYIISIIPQSNWVTSRHKNELFIKIMKQCSDWVCCLTCDEFFNPMSL